MSFPLYWAEDAIEHIAKPGVSRADVRDAMRRRFYWRNHARGVMVIGKTDGRFLLIIMVPSTSHSGSWEVRSARDATRSEKRLFIRRAKGFR